MKSLSMKFGTLAVTSLMLLACDRNAGNGGSSISVKLPESAMQKASASNTTLQLRHFAVQITAPDLATPIQVIVEAQNDKPLPSEIQVEGIPTGAGRLVQVLVAYSVGNRDGADMIFYGDVTQAFKNAEEKVEVPVTALGGGQGLKETKVRGRYLTSADSGPTGELSMRYRPAGKPSMPVDKSAIIAGWFEIMLFDDITIDYILPDGTFLGEGWTAANVAPSAQVAHMRTPDGYERHYMSGSESVWYPRKGENRVIGFFAKDPAFLADKKVCLPTPSTDSYLNLYTAADSLSAMPVQFFPGTSTVPTFGEKYATAFGGVAPSACSHSVSEEISNQFKTYIRIADVNYDFLNYQDSFEGMAGFLDGGGIANFMQMDYLNRRWIRNSHQIGHTGPYGLHVRFDILPGFENQIQELLVYSRSDTELGSTNCKRAVEENWPKLASIKPQFLASKMIVRADQLPIQVVGTVNVVCASVRGKPVGRTIQLNPAEFAVASKYHFEFANPVAPTPKLVVRPNECKGVAIRTTTAMGLSSLLPPTSTSIYLSASSAAPILYSDSNCSGSGTGTLILPGSGYGDLRYFFVKSPSPYSYLITASGAGAAPETLEVMFSEENATPLGFQVTTHFGEPLREITVPSNSCRMFRAYTVGGLDTTKSITGTASFSLYEADQATPRYTLPSGFKIVGNCITQSPISSINFNGSTSYTYFGIATGNENIKNVMLKVNGLALQSFFIPLNMTPLFDRIDVTSAGSLHVNTCQSLTLTTKKFDGTTQTMTEPSLIQLSGLSMTEIFSDATCSTPMSSFMATSSSTPFYFKYYGADPLQIHINAPRAVQKHYIFTAPMIVGPIQVNANYNVPLNGSTVAPIVGGAEPYTVTNLDAGPADVIVTGPVGARTLQISGASTATTTTFKIESAGAAPQIFTVTTTP